MYLRARPQQEGCQAHERQGRDAGVPRFLVQVPEQRVLAYEVAPRFLEVQLVFVKGAMPKSYPRSLCMHGIQGNGSSVSLGTQVYKIDRRSQTERRHRERTGHPRHQAAYFVAPADERRQAYGLRVRSRRSRGAGLGSRRADLRQPGEGRSLAAPEPRRPRRAHADGPDSHRCRRSCRRGSAGANLLGRGSLMRLWRLAGAAYAERKAAIDRRRGGLSRRRMRPRRGPAPSRGTRPPSR